MYSLANVSRDSWTIVGWFFGDLTYLYKMFSLGKDQRGLGGLV